MEKYEALTSCCQKINVGYDFLGEYARSKFDSFEYRFETVPKFNASVQLTFSEV